MAIALRDITSVGTVACAGSILWLCLWGTTLLVALAALPPMPGGASRDIATWAGFEAGG